MEREEAIKVLNTYDVNFDEHTAEEIADALDMAIEALQNEETFKTQLENCHREILRLLDFSDMTESSNDDIEPQNDVIEVVRCKDCIHHGMRDCPVWGDDTTEDYMWCYYGERRDE